MVLNLNVYFLVVKMTCFAYHCTCYTYHQSAGHPGAAAEKNQPKRGKLAAIVTKLLRPPTSVELYGWTKVSRTVACVFVHFFFIQF